VCVFQASSFFIPNNIIIAVFYDAIKYTNLPLPFLVYLTAKITILAIFWKGIIHV